MDDVCGNRLRSGRAARITPCLETRGTQRSRWLVFGCAVMLVLTLDAAGAAQEIGSTIPADDLPAEFKVLSGADAEAECRWTLVGENDNAHEQEQLHPEFNAVHRIWHFPLAGDTSVFKFEFTRPIRQGRNVFHVYVKADGDEHQGRKHDGIHQGVDYMFTLIDGDPQHASTRLDVFEAEGGTRRGTCNLVIHGATLYLAAEMSLQQRDGHSVFEYCVSSYVKDHGPSAGLGYARVASQPAPARSREGLLANPGMIVVNGTVPGWQIVGGSRPVEAKLSSGGREGGVVLEDVYWPEGLLQTVHLAAGRYLLRALAKTNVFQIHLVADRSRLPVAVADHETWVELPFCIPRSGERSAGAAQVGFRYLARPATGNASRLPARLAVKRVELIRLGDTVLDAQWAETLPADPLHRMKLIHAAPAWNRPGKVIFQDSFLGTELWLMTQEGRVDHTYVGHPNFSPDGKYLHIGFRRPPRGLLRTDGTARYLNDAWTGIVWPFPWEQKHLPQEGDPADWIVTSRSPAGIEMQNVLTDARHRIDLPTRSGWRIVHFPGIATYGGRGPNLRQITHQTLVWFSDDQQAIGRSDASGEPFETFPLRTVSTRPEADTRYADMSSVGGKAGDNWRDAVDRDGNRYFLFELNRDHFPDHPTNPYQVWALPLTPGDPRGLLRAVCHPRATMSEFVTSQTGITPQPSANWWNLAAGFPWSGDNAILQLEDGTLVHMSSLGMHSSFAGGSTVSVNGASGGEVRYVGSYPQFDRVSWPHEFRRDADYAVVASHAEPASPLVMIDLEHTAMWTLALTNFHDYAIRYKTRWNPDAYHKPMFRPAPGFSPDFTKVVFFSAMLTGDQPERKWGDVYVAVARYPEPPVKLRKEGAALVWDKPQRQAEIRGFRLYRSGESGQGYARVQEELLTGTRYELPPDADGCYVLTSVEYSGLESRAFSNEACVGGNHLFRHFYRPAAGKIARPLVPFFEPAGTGDGSAVAITDPDLIYQRPLAEGLRGSVAMPIVIPAAGPVRILARVRGLSALERASYTAGWPEPDPEQAGRGSFAVQLDGKTVGRIPVSGARWHWAAFDAGAVPLVAGVSELEIATPDSGIALDRVLVTNDPDFAPRGRGQVPDELRAVPQGLRIAPLTPADERVSGELFKSPETHVKIAWDTVVAPQGVAHYNVYRCETAAFEAEAETQLGSPSQPVFYDLGPPAGRTVYYRVRAVDAWGNRSPPSAALAVTH